MERSPQVGNIIRGKRTQSRAQAILPAGPILVRLPSPLAKAGHIGYHPAWRSRFKNRRPLALE